MANNYYTATGLMKATAQTPMLSALFAPWNLRGYAEDAGFYMISTTDDDPQYTFGMLHDGLRKEAGQLTRQFDEHETTLGGMLQFFGKHFECADDPFLLALIDEAGPAESDDDSPVSLEEICSLAHLFDDGHELQYVSLEGAWTCSKVRLHEFGGTYEFWSPRMTLRGATDHHLNEVERLDRAVRDQDAEAFVQLAEEIGWRLFGALTDKVFVQQCIEILAKHVAQHLVPEPAP